MRIVDFHIHSYFSTDSSETPENIVKSAIDKGLSAICFTDHYDLDWPEETRALLMEELTGEDIILKKKLNGLSDNDKIPLFTFTPEMYVKELTELRKKYEGIIDIGIGAEFGLRPGRQDLNEEYRYIKNHYKLDFCLGSLHLVDNHDPCDPKCWVCDYEDYIDEYFYELKEAISEFEDFDSLAHIDYIARYLPTLNDMKNDRELVNDFADSLYPKHADTIDDILKTIIKRKQALEINTGSLNKVYGHNHPTKEIMSRYKELGGERFSFGSDAHEAKNVGNGLTNHVYWS